MLRKLELFVSAFYFVEQTHNTSDLTEQMLFSTRTERKRTWETYVWRRAKKCFPDSGRLQGQQKSKSQAVRKPDPKRHTSSRLMTFQGSIPNHSRKHAHVTLYTSHYILKCPFSYYQFYSFDSFFRIRHGWFSFAWTLFSPTIQHSLLIICVILVPLRALTLVC